MRVNFEGVINAHDRNKQIREVMIVMQVRIMNLSKTFFSLRGEVRALTDVSLEIKDKEFFVLLGPSGCGKSTLLNLIAGLERPTKGEILFDDKIISSKGKKIFLTPKERNVAFVFQSYALYPHLSVSENIAFPLKVMKNKGVDIKDAIKRVASMLKISDLLPAKPAELSGGQRQRVAIARAIVRQPNVFLLDEPLSNLDAQLRTSMRLELKNLQHKLGITTIYVTHDQVEAMSLGDRIAVLKEGRIIQIGSPQELYKTPVNTFVAQFIGSPPMNLFETSFIEDSGEYFVRFGNKRLKVSQEKKKEADRLKSRPFILGIRPEDIIIHPLSLAIPGSFKAKVTSIEPLGKEALLNVWAEGRNITVLASDKEVGVNDTLKIEFNLKRCHFFRAGF